MSQHIDYTHSYAQANSHIANNLLACYGSGTETITLCKLDTPVQRLDGKRVSYELRSASLSVEASDPQDQAWACVLSDDYTYWSKQELTEIGFRFSGRKVINSPCDVFNRIIIM